MNAHTRLFSSVLVASTCFLAASSCSNSPKTLRGWHRVPINQGPVAIVNGEAVELPSHVAGRVERESAQADALASADPTPNPRHADAQNATGVEAAVSASEVIAPAVALPSAPEAHLAGFTFYFPSGGSALRIPAAVHGELVKAARASSHVTVIGRTDGTKYSPADEQVALRRALAGRAELIRAGVDPTRIAIEFASAAGYATANDTAKGRQANRRVEFVFATDASESAVGKL